MTITTVAPTVDANGISVPIYSDILAKMIADFQAIYGTGAYISPDSQDGQSLASIALGISHLNAAIVAVYNSFSPATAQGTALDSAIKINGLATRGAQSSSYCFGTVTGVPGTVITNGQMTDANGIVWKLNTSPLTIGAGGTVTGTQITCTVAGPISAAINTITTIHTPVAGWTAITNTSAAALGASTESDASIRIRQNIGVALPSQGMVYSIAAAVSGYCASFSNPVTAVRVYENATNSTDSNGIPAGNISVLAVGSSDGLVAEGIALGRPPGIPTYGSTAISTGGGGLSVETINFNRPTTVTVAVNITVKQIVNGIPITGGALPAPTIAAIQTSLQAAINATPIGLGAVSYFGLIPAAALVGNPLSVTYEVSAMTINKNGGSFSASDIAMIYTDMAVAGAVTVTVA